MTHYRQLIGEVTPADVTNILQTLSDGPRVEYIEEP